MIKNAIGRLGLIGAAMVLAGCASTVPPSEPKDVTEVVNLVKKELATYDRYRSENPVSIKPNRCNKDPKSGDTMDLTVSNVYLTLSAVANKGKNTSLTVPVFALNHAGAYSKSQTQTIKIPLSVIDSGLADAKNDTDADHSIAEALENFRNEILSVNHDDYPCLEIGDKNKIKVTLQFDVVKSPSTGVTSVQLANFRTGASAALIDEAHQTLEFDMDLVGKSSSSPTTKSKKKAELRQPSSPSSRKIKAPLNKPLASKSDAE